MPTSKELFEQMEELWNDFQDNHSKFVDKGKMTVEEGVSAFGRIYFCDKLDTLADADLVIEAIVEDLEIKKELFVEGIQ